MSSWLYNPSEPTAQPTTPGETLGVVNELIHGQSVNPPNYGPALPPYYYLEVPAWGDIYDAPDTNEFNWLPDVTAFQGVLLERRLHGFGQIEAELSPFHRYDPPLVGFGAALYDSPTGWRLSKGIELSPAVQFFSTLDHWCLWLETFDSIHDRIDRYAFISAFMSPFVDHPSIDFFDPLRPIEFRDLGQITESPFNFYTGQTFFGNEDFTLFETIVGEVSTDYYVYPKSVTVRPFWP